jgi:hypothetical protein
MLMDTFVTATSRIGFIAGAGIIVRNSIILVDFIELRRAQGMAPKQAVGCWRSALSADVTDSRGSRRPARVSSYSIRFFRDWHCR